MNFFILLDSISPPLLIKPALNKRRIKNTEMNIKHCGV